MKLFGYNLTLKKTKKDFVIDDEVPELKVTIPQSKKPTQIPAVKNPVMDYNSQRVSGRGSFQSAEYDLMEIGRIEDTDSYARQASDKKIALMFKEGWNFIGQDPRVTKYIKLRFAQIERASQLPTKKFIRAIGDSLVRKSNAFVVKVRDVKASGGKIRLDPKTGREIKPIAAYFSIPAETMEFRKNAGNKISHWRQRMPDGKIKTWRAEDVVHFTYCKKDGFEFGTPLLTPVVDDIRALRKIEENIELLVYQHLFPLFQYKVGTENEPAGFTEDGRSEVDVIKEAVRYMPTEGGIVTPHRHEILAIGAEGRAIRAEGYLEHFKKRVFAGLAVSAVDMGEGNCYSNDTQTLTENGWKYHWDIDHLNERIATYNPETKELEYHITNYKYEGHYEGDMILFKGKHVDLKVSPKHEMWVLNRHTGIYKKVFAKDLLAGAMKEYCFIDTISNFQGSSADVKIGDKTIDPKTWMDFFGWWLSEGSVDRYNASYGHYRTIISQKKFKDLETIRICLSKLPFNYREQVDKRDGTINFIIYSKDLYEKLEPLGTSLQKSITKEFLEYDSEHCSILLESLMRGDGTWDNRRGRKSGIYYTGSKQLADDVQILALQAGYSAKVTSKKNTGYSDGTIYRVLITKSDKNYRILTTDHISVEHYSNTIYCYNVENHLFLTRRNGIIGIHGNTANRACYSEDTQTLTDSGFKYYWEITPDDKIATFNPDANAIEFQYPRGNILLYHYHGKMIEFKNRNNDVLVTPDHDMWMGRPRNGGDLTWEKIKARDIDIEQFKFRSGQLNWQGNEEPEDFVLPYVPYNCYSYVPNEGPWPAINIEDWLQFLGFYVSEGTLAKTSGKWAINISQNSRVNPDKTRYIRSILERLPFKFNEYTDPKDQTTRFWINCKSLYLYLEDQCGDYSYRKHLPHEVLDYSRPYLQVLLEALMVGDGTEDRRRGRTSRTYYSNSQQLIDQVQEIALKVGYRAHVLNGQRCKRVCMSWAEVSNVTKAATREVDYDGMVYCFNVPNHLFITRRNGRIGVHGNTADNMSRNLVDAVKDIQQVVEIEITNFLIDELLLESTFGDDVLNEESRCSIKFKEIDIESQVKKEAHAADQFTKDLLTWDEARIKSGYDPISVPTQEEMDSGVDLQEKYAEWNKTRWKLFQEPTLLIQAIDEPYSPAAKAASMNNSLGMTKQDVQQSVAEKKQLEADLKKKGSKEKAIAKSTSKKVKNGFISQTYNEVRADVVSRVIFEQKMDYEWIGALVRTQMLNTVEVLTSQQVLAFRNGYRKNNQNLDNFVSALSSARSVFNERAEKYINRLTENIISSLRRNVENTNSISKLTDQVTAVFDALKFRTNFIEDVEIEKAYWYGYALAAKDSNQNTLVQESLLEKTTCDLCKDGHSQELLLNYVVMEDVPPHHPGCKCSLKQKGEDNG